MQCVTRANKIRVGAAALLTLFMAYYAVIAFYTHVHVRRGFRFTSTQ